MKVFGLDDAFDELIGGLPETLFRAADDAQLDDAFSRDPYTPLRDLRDRVGPVVRRGEDGLFAGTAIPNIFMHEDWVPRFAVLGYDAHAEIVRDAATFVNGDGAYGAHSYAVGKIVTLTDGAEHSRYRDLVLQAFGRSAVGRMEESLVRPVIEYLVDRMAKRIAAGEPCDIVRDLSLPLTYKVMASLLGLPNETLTDFVHWGDAMFNAATDMEAGMNGAVSLSQMFYAELEKRRTTPGDDLLTWMLEAEARGSRLDDDEIVTHARFFLPAGIETTSRSVSLTLLTLLEDRSRYEEVTAQPELIHAAVEECSRYATGGFVAGRRAVKDTVVAGVEIPERSLMLHVQGLCNRDPARWENPDTFDMHRPHKAHLLFNMGIHTCAGMHLARLEMEGAVRALIERVPGLQLAVPREEIAVRGFQIRTPIHVPVTAS